MKSFDKKDVFPWTYDSHPAMAAILSFIACPKSTRIE